MNIVKFKDTVAPTDMGLSDAAWFNENLRGRYAYWILCQYVVPLESIEVDTAIECEIDGVSVLDRAEVKYLDIFDQEYAWVREPEYWDNKETDAVNSVEKYLRLNAYTPDDDITLDELKNFRNWLAGEMLKYGEWEPDTVHMLEYYANGMNDEIVKWLSYFGIQKPTVSSSFTSTNCGCSGTSNLSSLYSTDLTLTCDSLAVYKNNIKSKMIEVFSDIETWKGLRGSGLLEDIVKYLDNIVTVNLPLVSTGSTVDVFSCKCLGDTNYAQKSMQDILGSLAASFQYIIDGDDVIKTNKNKIATSLSDWATNLYENMEWD